MKAAFKLMQSYNQSLASVIVRSFDNIYSKELQSFCQRICTGITEVSKLATLAFDKRKGEESRLNKKKDEMIEVLKGKNAEMM